MALILKNSGQVDGIRKSCHLARNTLKYITQFIKPGITTAFINQKVEEYVRDQGGVPATLNYRGYPAASCTSVNDVVCHGIPGDYVLKEGDLLNVDVSTILNGFFGDTCMMYPIGEVPDSTIRLMKATRHCLDLGIAQCRPGNKLGNIGYVISEYARKMGYSVVYQFCGHGVGLSLHEEPEVSHIEEANTGITIQPGMTFTIEPMINQGKARVKMDKKDGWTARTIDGRLSAQYEHTVFITEKGVEVLTDVDGEYNEKGELTKEPYITFS
jgi:methionyl aminopeptidase